MRKILNIKNLAVLIIILTSTTIVYAYYFYPKQSKETADYEDLQNDYLFAKAQFKPGDCKKVVVSSESKTSISSTENMLITAKCDNFQKNALKPRNKKLIFLDQKEKILFTISCFHTNKFKEPDIVAIDTLYKKQTKAWFNDDVTRYPYDQFIIIYRESFILIDCTYLDKNTYSEAEVAYFKLRSRLFFQEFANFLNDK
ncbi:MAG: hypothetical protein EOM28_03860 [Clostridia bacterium]|nr:hypothetical protein [Clostridia bacterium]